MKIKLNQRGFTFVEMMFAIMLAGIVGYVMFASARAGNEQMDTREARMTLQDNAREGLYKMLQELRQSAPSKITIGSGGTSGSTIQFQVPDSSNLVQADYTLNWSVAKTVQYSVSSNQLIRTNVSSGSTAVLANNVSSVTFTGDTSSPNKITVALTLQITVRDNGRTLPNLTMTGQAEIRNH